MYRKERFKKIKRENRTYKKICPISIRKKTYVNLSVDKWRKLENAVSFLNSQIHREVVKAGRPTEKNFSYLYTSIVQGSEKYEEIEVDVHLKEIDYYGKKYYALAVKVDHEEINLCFDGYQEFPYYPSIQKAVEVANAIHTAPIDLKNMKTTIEKWVSLDVEIELREPEEVEFEVIIDKESSIYDPGYPHTW